MIKVLRIINRFNIGGPTYNVVYLSKYLGDDFETMLVGGEKDETENSSMHIVENLGLKPIIIKEMRRSINPLNDVKAYFKIKQMIREYKPDIVHTHASKSGVLGRLAASHCGVPIIIHTFHGHVFHSYFSSFKTTLFKKIERYLAKKSTKIIAISEIQKNELVNEHQIASAEKFQVVPLGFDLERFYTNQEEKRKTFRTNYYISDDEIIVGIVGRLVPIKNHELFLDAATLVKEKSNQKIRFFIVGDGEKRADLENYCSTKSLSYSNNPEDKSDVIFTSWIQDIDVVNAGVDIIALTSLNEGTPVSLIEAQASGKPIVTTNVGGIKDVVIPNETAFVTGFDANEISEKILKLVNDKELYQSFSSKGLAFVKDHFHYTRLCNDMGRLYKELMK